MSRLVVTTAGVDIGSATTHVMASELTLDLDRESSFRRYVVTDRVVTRRSPVYWTPYRADGRLDGDRIRALVRETLDAELLARLGSGVVLLTGEALRRDNAEQVAIAVADVSANGALCISAGHRWEAWLTAHGSGAVELSRDKGCSVLLVDVGGGTTKLAMIDEGVIRWTAAVHVGGRLLSFDPQGRIVRLEPVMRQFAARAGVRCELGQTIDRTGVDALSEVMVDTIIDLVTPGRSTLVASELVLAAAPESPGERANYLMIAGGVGEFVYDPDAPTVGDLGHAIGRDLRERLVDVYERPLVAGANRLHATIVGLSQYTVHIGGETGWIPDPEMLPVHNLPFAEGQVVLAEEIAEDRLAAEIIRRTSARGPSSSTSGRGAAVSVCWRGDPSQRRLSSVACALLNALRQQDEESILLVVLDQDVGRLVGRAAAAIWPQGARRLVVIDGIGGASGDFIDVGPRLNYTDSVAVTIKSLLF